MNLAPYKFRIIVMHHTIVSFSGQLLRARFSNTQGTF